MRNDWQILINFINKTSKGEREHLDTRKQVEDKK